MQKYSDGFCKMTWPDHDAARACITAFPDFLLKTKIYIMFTTNDLTCNQYMALPCFVAQVMPVSPKGLDKAVLLAWNAVNLHASWLVLHRQTRHRQTRQ